MGHVFSLISKFSLGSLSAVSEILVKALLSMLSKLVTEEFLARIFMIVFDTLARKSESQLDDKIVAAIADALGVPTDSLFAVIKNARAA